MRDKNESTMGEVNISMHGVWKGYATETSISALTTRSRKITHTEQDPSLVTIRKD